MTLTNIFAAMVESGNYAYDLKYAEDPRSMRSDYVEAVLENPAAYAAIVEACWNNGAANELQEFLKGSGSSKLLSTLEKVSYCNRNPLEDDTYMFLRGHQVAADLGLNIGQLIISRIRAIFDDQFALHKKDRAA